MVATTTHVAGLDRNSRYCVAFLDWLACASAGASERAATAVLTSGDDLLTRIAFVGTAGHVFDYDDTFAAGVAHVSAACAPAALVVAADRKASLREALTAYADGYEAMARLAAAGHPTLYENGWHPTAVCGPVGAAVTAGRLLGLSDTETEQAVRLSMLRSGGMRGAFGSDGKAIQVGLAAAAGVQAALLAANGATASARVIHSASGFEGVFGVSWPEAGSDQAPAIESTWIKRYASCLGTHAPIEAGCQARAAGYRLEREPLQIRVHPTARGAAHLDDVENGLEAKFSIPYCVAHTLAHGPPRLRDFAGVDATARRLARLITVEVDPSLPEFGAVLSASGQDLAEVSAPAGSPEYPLSAGELGDKVSELAGPRLDGVLDPLDQPAAGVLARAFHGPLSRQVQGEARSDKEAS